jgi:predicted RND superfamily exporter protein
LSAESKKPGLTDRWLSALATLCLRGPWLVLLVCVMLAGVGVFEAYQKLHFSSDRTDMLDPNQPIQKSWRSFKDKFGKVADFIVLVKGADREQGRQSVEDLASRLKAQPDLLDNVFYRLDLPDMATRALYYLSAPDLNKLKDMLTEVQPWLKILAVPNGFVKLSKDIATDAKPEVLAKKLLPVLPLLRDGLHELVSTLESRGAKPFHSSLPKFNPDLDIAKGSPIIPGQTRFYNTLADGQTFIIFATAHNRSGDFSADVNTDVEIRKAISLCQQNHPDTNFMLSGEPVINTDEMVGAKNDALRSAGLAILLVTLLLSTAYKGLFRPLLVLLALLVGLSWSAGFAAVSVGTLNLLTVHFMTILVGLGMTFGVQVLYRYQDDRSRLPSVSDSLHLTLATCGKENFIAASTTAVAFWALHFTAFRSAGELGLITGTGVVLCFFAMLTVLPCLFVLTDTDGRCWAPLPPPAELISLDHATRRHPWAILVISLLLSLLSLNWATRIPFDFNLLHMHQASDDSVRVENYLEGVGYSTLFGVCVAPNMQAALNLTKQFQALPTVSRVESVASLLPTNVAEKQPIIEQIVRLAGVLNPPAPMGMDSAQSLLTLYSSFKGAEHAIREMVPIWERGPERRTAEQLSKLFDRLDRDLTPDNPGPAEDGMGAFESRERADFDAQLRFLKMQQAKPPRVMQQIPHELKMRSISADGEICLRIFPKADIWERAPLEAFCNDITRVDKNVTGSPLLIYFYVQALKDAYSVSGRNALLVICLLLLIHFRSVRLAALALLPKLTGVLWMMGIMGVCGVDFNPANFMALPLTLGIGLIFGVHVLNEVQGSDHSIFETSTGPAVLLAGLTTMLGFATLLTAEHRGVASFAFVMTAGVGANLVTSLFMLPALVGRLRAHGFKIS